MIVDIEKKVHRTGAYLAEALRRNRKILPLDVFEHGFQAIIPQEVLRVFFWFWFRFCFGLGLGLFLLSNCLTPSVLAFRSMCLKT